MKTTVALLAFAIFAVPVAASSQQFPDLAMQLDRADRGQFGTGRSALPRVQVNYQLQVPTDRNGSVDDQKASIATVHDALYDLIAHECEHLQTAFKADCRIASMSIGNIGQTFNNTSTATASASATFDLFTAAARQSPPKP